MSELILLTYSLLPKLSKGHIIPDQDLFTFLDAIDDAVMFSGTKLSEKEKVLMEVYKLKSKLSKLVWQCSSCGTIFIDKGGPYLASFKPSKEEDKAPILMSKKSFGGNV